MLILQCSGAYVLLTSNRRQYVSQALATIEKMKRCNVQAHNCAMGRLIRQGWQEAADETGAPLTVLCASFDL
jgi:hypothetical protein